jgi:hypothetical protein
LTSLLITALAFQIGSPGQYPPGQYPPGGYPPGRYPGTQGPGIPIPRRGKKTTTTDKKAAEEPTLHFTGKLRTFDEKSFEMDAPDTRTLVFQINDKTKKPTDLKAGDNLAVDAREDENGYYVALNVTKTDVPASGDAKTAAPGKSPEPAASTEPEAKSEPAANVLRGPKYDVGDDGPPKLRRGKPVASARKKPVAEEEATPATAAAGATEPSAAPSANAPVDTRVAFIQKAQEAASGFLGGLPNYVCQQQTTRYVTEGNTKSWHAVDVISVDVVYEGGREKYEHLAINGKASKKPPEESGAWSTGEFGTVLADLFSPSTAARFKYKNTARIAGFDASVYDFSVERSHSHWKVYYRSQFIYPAYRGTIWLDSKTARTLRIEMQAVDIPKEFLADTTESAVDYELVSLGAEKFLLPVHSEVLSCQRGTSVCDKNVIEFRNYHKFTGESKILFSQ